MQNLSLTAAHLWKTRNFSFYARFFLKTLKPFKMAFHYWKKYLRRLTGESVIFFPLLLLLLFALNIAQPKTSFESTKDSIMTNPKSFTSHFTLAKQSFLNNQFALSESELTTAGLNSKGSEEKEEITMLQTQINLSKQEPVKLQGLILDWQKIINTYSSYRDGYMKLAILNWKLYRSFESRKFMEKTLQTDPNNTTFSKYSLSLN